MGVVAVGASHLAFSIRHVGRAHELSLPYLVALEADLHFGFFCKLVLI